MYSALSAGTIGVSFDTLERGLELARIGGFDGLELSGDLVKAAVAAEGAAAVRERFDRAGIRPAGFGLPVDFRGDNYDEAAAISRLKPIARAMKEIGATRCATWIMPADDARNHDAMWDLHVSRLAPLNGVLHDEGISLGLEFVGPKTLRDRFRYPFVYTMKGMLSMCAAIGPGTGLLLDIFHLFTSGGTLAQLRQIPRSRIIYVHINDARDGRELHEQIDNERELPGATGVLDLPGFLSTLKEMGYDGPIVAEPFLDRLKELPDDESRVREVGLAVKDALAIVGS